MKGRLLVVLVVLALGLGCAGGLASGSRHVSLFPAWPSGDPRVRLERIVETQRDLGHSAFFRRLTGQGPQALFDRPYGVAWYGEDLLVTDPGAGVVLNLTQEGKILRTLPGELAEPIAVVACLDGIVVTDSRSGRVGLFDQKLRLVRWLAEDLNRPTGVACVSGGVAVVETAAHRIVILRNDGGRQEIGQRGDGPGEFNFPTAVVADGTVLWAGDTLNFRIVEIDVATGQVVRTFGHLGDSPGETPRIKGLAIDIFGHLWVSDAHLDLVSLFDRNGVFLMDIGGTGKAEGEFSFPAGIAAHMDGRVAVVDSLNRRIQIFKVLDHRPEGTDGGG